MMEEKLIVRDIPQEKFAFVQRDERIHDERLQTKAVGYLGDAWNRFRKNKSSVVAAVIILILFMYLMRMNIRKLVICIQRILLYLFGRWMIFLICLNPGMSLKRTTLLILFLLKIFLIVLQRDNLAPFLCL